MAALRDEFIPKWIADDECGREKLERLKTRLVSTVVHCMIDEKDASLRTDVLLMSVWIDHLLAGEEKESKHAKAPRKAPNFHAIREMHDLPIEDIKANT